MESLEPQTLIISKVSPIKTFFKVLAKILIIVLILVLVLFAVVYVTYSLSERHYIGPVTEIKPYFKGLMLSGKGKDGKTIKFWIDKNTDYLLENNETKNIKVGNRVEITAKYILLNNSWHIKTIKVL